MRVSFSTRVVAAKQRLSQQRHTIIARGSPRTFGRNTENDMPLSSKTSTTARETLLFIVCLRNQHMRLGAAAPSHRHRIHVLRTTCKPAACKDFAVLHPIVLRGIRRYNRLLCKHMLKRRRRRKFQTETYVLNRTDLCSCPRVYMEIRMHAGNSIVPSRA